MLLQRNVWANLGTHSALEQHFDMAESVGLMADTAASAPHTLPPAFDFLLSIASGLYTHGLSWAAASSEPLSGIPCSKRIWSQIPKRNWQANRWMVAAWSLQALAFFPDAFSFSTPCLVAQSRSRLYRLNMHKKLFCLAIHLPNGALSYGVNWL